MRRLFFAALLLVLTCTLGQAAIIYNYISAEQTVSGTWRYEYEATLASDTQINTNRQPAFAVIYDFYGYINGSYLVFNIAPQLTITRIVEGTTAVQPFAQHAPDDPTVINLYATITGVYNPPQTAALFRVYAESTYGPGYYNMWVSGQALKDDGRVLAGNSTLLPGPAEVPEPAPLVLIGAGMCALAFLRRR